MDQTSTFIIVRDDLDVDPARIISEGLLIGRNPVCELLLNHSAVSRIQAGIKFAEGGYYIYNLRPSNPFRLNGRAVEQKEALAMGDVLEIGPFVLEIESTLEDSLTVKISHQIGLETESAAEMISPNEPTRRLPDLQKVLSGQMSKISPAARPPARAHGDQLDDTKALDIFWSNRIDDAHKLVGHSPLFPEARRNPPKRTRYDWRFTTDLARTYPARALMLGALLACLLSVAAAFWYASAYAPGKISGAHSRTSLSLSPAIAGRPNAGSCTNCHATKTRMDDNCSSCHQSEAFSATIIPGHKAAGIGCTNCHDEHRGADFHPSEAALQTCTGCHNNANRNLYNGRAVSTPHGGALGYPVTAGKWTWKGLDEDEWSLKQVNFARAPNESEDQWRSKQFHAIHLYRVKAIQGMPANKEGEMSCSSCHKSFNPIDRQTPRATCATCHNGRTDERTGRTLIAADAPNCTSCHVQHIKDRRHWNSSLLTASAQ